MEELRSFETPEITRPKARRHISEDLNIYCYIPFSPFLSKSVSRLWRHDLLVFPLQPPEGTLEVTGLQSPGNQEQTRHAVSVSRIAV
jgi:hypothetical protein